MSGEPREQPKPPSTCSYLAEPHLEECGSLRKHVCYFEVPLRSRPRRHSDARSRPDGPHDRHLRVGRQAGHRLPGEYDGPDGRRHRPTLFLTKQRPPGWRCASPRSSARRGSRRRPQRRRPQADVRGLRRPVAVAPPLKARTREHYRWLLDDHLIPEFGTRPLRSITSDEVRVLARPLRHRHAHGRGRTATGCCGPSWPPLPATGRSA